MDSPWRGLKRWSPSATFGSLLEGARAKSVADHHVAGPRDGGRDDRPAVPRFVGCSGPLRRAPRRAIEKGTYYRIPDEKLDWLAEVFYTPWKEEPIFHGEGDNADPKTNVASRVQD